MIAGRGLDSFSVDHGESAERLLLWLTGSLSPSKLRAGRSPVTPMIAGRALLDSLFSVPVGDHGESAEEWLLTGSSSPSKLRAVQGCVGGMVAGRGLDSFSVLPEEHGEFAERGLLIWSSTERTERGASWWPLLLLVPSPM